MKVNQHSRYGAVAKAWPQEATLQGKVFFVGTTSLAWWSDFLNVFPSDEDGGTRSFSTLEGALNDANVVASRGDVILIAQGHTENVASATALNFDKAGVTIVGQGTGSLRPTYTLTTATTATIPVTAANVTVKNVIFSANFADIVAFFTLTTAKWFTIDSCRFQATATDMNAKYIIDTNATTNDAQGLKLVNSTWIEPDAATISVAKVDGTNADWIVDNNYFSLAAVQATGGSMFVIATGKILTNLRCRDNHCIFLGGDLSGAGVVFTTDGSTNSGVFARNFIQHTDTASEIFGTASSGFSFFENRMTGVAGATGYVLPAVDS